MNYEEIYKEALNKAKSRMENSVGGCLYESDIKEIFPELAESEDEKIRKEIIDYLKSFIPHNEYDLVTKSKQWIDWLEKQNHDGKKWIYEDVYIKEKEEIYQDGVDNVLENPQKYGLEKQGQVRKISHEEICKSYGIPDIGEFSDGYHTFNGLYKQRMILFAVLVKTYKDKAWKSWKHEDGLDCFGGGWFIVGIDTPAGTYTYHYEAKDWDRFDCQILEKAKHWDGHNEFDVERLFTLVSNETSSVNLEPKFKGGDWVVDNRCGEVRQVVFLEDDGYEFQSGGWVSYEDANKHFHLWTINDAKEGDVLVASDGSLFIFAKVKNNSAYYHISLCKNGSKQISNGTRAWEVAGACHPATKEQRDLLFKNMKEAGYEWDGKKKELKKIEQRSIDNLEPKFKVGDWVRAISSGNIFKILSVNDGLYRVLCYDGIASNYPIVEVEKDLAYWTINDAKDGDVLAVDGRPFIYNGSKDAVTVGAYCGFNEEHRFSFAYNYAINRNITPTTKEQRDLLFQKIKEAGYEWDSKMKQLIKLY